MSKIVQRRYSVLWELIYLFKILSKNSNLSKEIEEKYEKSLLKSLKKNTKKTGRLKLEVREKITPQEFYQEYLIKSKPVLIKNALKSWPAMKKWNLEFFKKNYGNTEFGIFHVNSKGEKKSEVKKLKDIIKSFENPSERNEIKFMPFMKKMPELKDDIGWTDIRRFGRIRKTSNPLTKLYQRIFFVPKNAETEIHMAAHCNLFANIFGKKRWIIFPPENSPLIYPVKWIPDEDAYFVSEYKFKKGKIDGKKPLTEYLTYYEVLLDDGDLLYVPPFHWHWVNSESPCLSITFMFLKLKNVFRTSPFFFFLCLRPHYKLWRKKVDPDKFEKKLLESSKS